MAIEDSAMGSMSAPGNGCTNGGEHSFSFDLGDWLASTAGRNLTTFPGDGEVDPEDLIEQLWLFVAGPQIDRRGAVPGWSIRVAEGPLSSGPLMEDVAERRLNCLCCLEFC